MIIDTDNYKTERGDLLNATLIRLLEESEINRTLFDEIKPKELAYMIIYGELSLDKDEFLRWLEFYNK
jgi:hypothetical protein